ncbi:TetR/AcrR family transcriptional regulator [Nocardioides sp. NPDC087217]|uniref:TetR/AcrR family transcriptional regulator n=1 Tax=Nocardioides sp. NPDC087217 TaxID=3364335 RepID=UPI0037F66F68
MSQPVRAEESFYDAGLEILASDGYAGLKLAPLCAHLGVTTGSFYHRFDNWADFTGRLIAHWHQQRTTMLVNLVAAEPDPIHRLKMLHDVAMSLPHRAEAAIRAWSAIDPSVRAVQAAVDEERYQVVLETFRALVPEQDAMSYARTALFLVAGRELAGDDSSHDETADATLSWALRLLINTATTRP